MFFYFLILVSAFYDNKTSYIWNIFETLPQKIKDIHGTNGTLAILGFHMEQGCT
jgi:hypothetical protein